MVSGEYLVGSWRGRSKEGGSFVGRGGKEVGSG